MLGLEETIAQYLLYTLAFYVIFTFIFSRTK